jgi:hypothetical protein
MTTDSARAVDANEATDRTASNARDWMNFMQISP